MDAVAALAPGSGLIAAACTALGLSRASFHRRQALQRQPPAAARPCPAKTRACRTRAPSRPRPVTGADGAGVEVERLKTTPEHVSLWPVRFETSGLAALDDKPGRGRKPSISNAKAARVVTEVTRPPQGKTRWSIRSMSRYAGISPSTVQRTWSKNDLKPHRVKTFKLSNDPKFEEKFWDVIGLYLSITECSRLKTSLLAHTLRYTRANIVLMSHYRGSNSKLPSWVSWRRASPICTPIQ
jgi:hypothetical protein